MSSTHMILGTSMLLALLSYDRIRSDVEGVVALDGERVVLHACGLAHEARVLQQVRRQQRFPMGDVVVLQRRLG